MDFQRKSIHLIIIITGCWCGLRAECPRGSFRCNSSQLCVPQLHICDGKFHCADRSDEWQCDSEHQVEFWNMLFKKRPDEDADKVAWSQAQCALSNAPARCLCHTRRLLCANTHLSQVPSPLPNDTAHLDLSSNGIQHIGSRDFQQLAQLHTLLLSNCLIRSIANDAFQPLTRLHTLYLTGNRLETLAEGLFVGNKQLHSLDLSFNRIWDLNENNWLGLDQVQQLDLRGNRLSSLKTGLFRHLNQLQVLYLNDNHIQQLSWGHFHHLLQLRLLYVTHNRISYLGPQAFHGLPALNGLFLSWNQLQQLQSLTFENISTLLNLDVSHNQLFHLDEDVFHPLAQLQFLNLQANPFRSLPKNLLQPLTHLSHIHFEDFYLCAFALGVRVCEPKSDGISSTDNLLDSMVLRVSVWLVASLACAGNLLVLLGRLLLKEPNQVHSWYIKSLGVSDLLMGIYLFVVAAYDLHFRGRYIEVDAEWRSSWQCQFLGFLSTLSSEASVLTLSIITYDRYFSISRPLSLQRRTKRFAAICTLFLWLAAFVFALTPIPFYGHDFYGNNGVCLPLHIHRAFAQGWQYSALVFIGVNFVAFTFICYAYINMFLIIKNSTLSLRSTQERQDRTIAQRFAFIVGTDLICWMPIILIKIMALCGVRIEDKLYAWLAIFVLPVNSALNPILYTLTTKLFRQQVLRWRCAPASSSGGNVGARNQPESLGLSLSYVFFHRASWSKRTTNQSGRSHGSKEWARAQNAAEQQQPPCNVNSTQV